MDSVENKLNVLKDEFDTRLSELETELIRIKQELEDLQTCTIEPDEDEVYAVVYGSKWVN